MHRLFSIALVLFVSAATAHAASFQSLFAPDAELWERWTAHDESSTETIDHAAWNEFLARYRHIGPDGIARIDYAAVTAEDRQSLISYIESLADLPISTYSRDAQFAYWVNLYNALTIEVVLDAYPVDSIRDIDISPGLFADGSWGVELITIEGVPVTLNDIEHRILRPIWQDPRVHYAVNCASVGCPNLAATAYSAAELDSMLEEAARTYVNHPRGVRFENGELVVSRIYDWFYEDFGESEADIIAHLRSYAEPELAAALGQAEGIDGYEYDWSLNDVR